MSAHIWPNAPGDRNFILSRLLDAVRAHETGAFLRSEPGEDRRHRHAFATAEPAITAPFEIFRPGLPTICPSAASIVA